VHFADRADGAGLQQFDRLTHRVARVTLIPHLRRHFHFFGNARHQSCLPDVVRQRLLAVDVLVCLHRHDAHVCVQVVGGRAQHRVDLLLLRQHLAEVGVLSTAEVRRRLFVVALDHRAHGLPPGHAAEVKALEIEILGGIRHGDHLCVRLLEQRPQIAASLTAGADQRDVHLIAWRDLSWPAEDVSRDDGQRRCRDRALLEKCPP
jgi:hypothetical protein